MDIPPKFYDMESITKDKTDYSATLLFRIKNKKCESDLL